MAWIELHQSVWTHRKTFALADELSVDEMLAAAYMIRLWCWALDNAQDGNLIGISRRAIARGAGWQEDPEVFVAAAVKAGYIDQDDDGLRLHDWYDYAGKLIERRRAERERMARRRAAERMQNVRSTTDEQPANDRQTTGGTVPNRTIPNKDDGSSFPSRPKEPTYAPEDMELAERHRDLILEIKPDARVPKSLANWAKTYRLMREQDDRARERILQVLEWAMKDSFWQRNILSPDKLRRQFDRLELEMAKPRNGTRMAMPRGLQAVEEWVRANDET